MTPKIARRWLRRNWADIARVRLGFKHPSPAFLRMLRKCHKTLEKHNA